MCQKLENNPAMAITKPTRPLAPVSLSPSPKLSERACHPQQSRPRFQCASARANQHGSFWPNTSHRPPKSSHKTSNGVMESWFLLEVWSDFSASKDLHLEIFCFTLIHKNYPSGQMSSCHLWAASIFQLFWVKESNSNPPLFLMSCRAPLWYHLRTREPHVLRRTEDLAALDSLPIMIYETWYKLFNIVQSLLHIFYQLGAIMCKTAISPLASPTQRSQSRETLPMPQRCYRSCGVSQLVANALRTAILQQELHHLALKRLRAMSIDGILLEKWRRKKRRNIVYKQNKQVHNDEVQDSGFHSLRACGFRQRVALCSTV